MKLKLVKTIKIIPTTPFDFDSTFHKPDHFTSGDNFWEKGIKWQTWWWKDISLGLKFIGKGTREKPKLIVEIYSDKKLDKGFVDSLSEEIKYRYNLNLDLTGFYKTFAKDEVLGPIIRKFNGMRPGHPSSLYEYLLIGIVLQNATVRRSVKMFRALLESCGTLLEFDNRKLWCFFKPGSLQKVSEDELRALKLGYRAKSIKKTDDFFAQGLIDEMELRKM